ncbi:PREDICTED: G-type lectin S-receptor-like serine/threonine-protein kinase SD3-1 [Lupinus angustifolius]|uniref:G-type lectin S-receptor-like serine/threonine-protein kinase SD3-1 n=1 Tax=Lupinus angustifolius TaxID=3871 RepID=UPI00092E2071|nr:PREDICTED: G-type lectin S-receptor-like serine/threonine-protein kinase SD3-1 [Lupinus angustifolius]
MFEQDCFITSLFLLCIFNGFLSHPLVAGVIPLGSKLSVIDNDCWVSSNVDFAIEFFNTSDEPNQYSVGIRFNSKSLPYSQQKLVWVTGNHQPVGNKSYFQLTLEGELVLFDPLQGVATWNSGTGNIFVVSAALHNNGNLVLKDRKQNIIWQSFDHPSDTLLPGQTFYAYAELLPTPKIPMSSPYRLYMKSSGHLQLQWFGNITYWRSEIPSASSNLTASLTTSGALQILDQSSKPIWSVFGEDHNDSVNYRFLKLDVDGNLRFYSWIEASQSWRTVWQTVENQCKVFAICGRGGICVLTASGSADCLCPFEKTLMIQLSRVVCSNVNICA